MTSPRAKSEPLLTEWSRRYRLPLVGFFRRRTGSEVDHEDLAQEVFARLARRDHLGSVEAVEPYIFQTASSVLTDHFRKRRVRAAGDHVPYDHDLPSDTELGGERVLQGKQTLAILMQALDDLPDRPRRIFSLYHFDDLSQKAIAQRLGVSVSTVEKDMARTNLHLLARLRASQ